VGASIRADRAHWSAGIGADILCAMHLREAVDLVYGLAEQFPEGSETRTALRLVARTAERGHRISSATLPAMSSAIQSVTMARAILAMALEGGKVREAAREALQLLESALGLVEKRLSTAPPPHADPLDDDAG
jgi:hypothetical protein